ncbi:MAG TPA: hypothetical protein PLJ35_14315, partial [Anaerolineae bacterium]|nr:hypothetical protein [Anaerolineae bacterium]
AYTAPVVSWARGRLPAVLSPEPWPPLPTAAFAASGMAHPLRLLLLSGRLRLQQSMPFQSTAQE